MGCPTVKKAFEESLRKDSLQPTDEFLVYQSGTIYNVTYTDLIADISDVGSITTDGDQLATPILAGSSPNYIIKGLRGGNGIGVTANINGSVTVNAQLGNKGSAEDGERVLDNITGNQLKLKRIKAGAGIGVESLADSIIITNEALSSTTSTIVISQSGDLPSAVAGVITLAANTTYSFISDVATANRFVLGDNTVIRADDFRSAKITYTGTDAMFTLVEGSQTFKDIELDCPNGTLFNNDDSIGSLLLRWVVVDSVKNLGSLGKDFTGIYNVLIRQITGDSGFSYAAESSVRFNMEQLTIQQTADPLFAFLDLGTATFEAFSLTNIDVLDTVGGQVFLQGAAAGANMAGDTNAYVSRINIQGDMAGLATITAQDVGYDFSDCNTIAVTKPIALNTLTAIETTTIPAINTAVPVNGLFNASVQQVFLSSASGRNQYIGKREILADVTINFTAKPAAASKTCAFYLALNGQKIDASIEIAFINTSEWMNFVIVWALPLVQGDYVELWCENQTDDVDLQFRNVQFRVKA